MWKIKETEILLKKGDITDSQTEAIVNAANTKLKLGAGVAGAIRKKGGPKIQEECNLIGEIILGDAVITSGGKLKAKFVIHAASMHLGSKTTKNSLKKSILNSLLRGSEKELTSIAFPAIGTGIAGFPTEECAYVMVEIFKEFICSRQHNYDLIEVVLFTEKDFKTFKEIFRKTLK